MNDSIHINIIEIAIGYTVLGAFIFTVVITCLSLVGMVTFSNQRQQRILFFALILELPLLGLGIFNRFLSFNIAAARNTIQEAPINIVTSSGQFVSSASELTQKDEDNRDEVVENLTGYATTIGNNLRAVSPEDRIAILRPLADEIQDHLPSSEEQIARRILAEAAIDEALLDILFQSEESDYYHNWIEEIVPDQVPNTVTLDGLSLIADMETTLYSGESDVVWYEFVVESADQYTVNVSSVGNGNDLVAAIYVANNAERVLDLLFLDDDSGGNLNPQISRQLDGGTYYLRISDYYGEVLDDLSVSVSSQ